MSGPVTVNPPLALDRLSSALAQWQEVSGRTSESALVLKGGQLLFGNRNPKFGATFKGLYQLFRAQAPRDGEIFAQAKARGFRLGRKAYGGDLSPTALARAEAMMGGHKTVLANVSEEGQVSFVRRGVRGNRRVRYRHGRKSFAVAGDDDRIKRFGGEKALNLRAVATYFELQLREQGRGFTGAGWLHKRWRNFAKMGFVPEGTPGLAPGWGPSRQYGGTDRRLVNVNPRSQLKLLGEAKLSSGRGGAAASLQISSFVPGVMELGNRRGLFAQAINAVVADIETYLARKQAEAIAAGVGANFL